MAGLVRHVELLWRDRHHRIFDIIEIFDRYSLTNIGFRDKISQIFDNSVIRGYRSILERVMLRQGGW